MPKKKNQDLTKNFVSHSYVHPSLSRGTASASSAQPGTGGQQVNVVSDRIEYLRRAQSRGKAITRAEDLMSSRHAVPAPRRSRISGPPPPRSWIVSNEDRQEYIDRPESVQRYPRSSTHLMGSILPGCASLSYQAMKAMAINLEVHIEYDHFYLSTLPISIKCRLLNLIARCGPEVGVSAVGMRRLFASPAEARLGDASGSQEVEDLDLTGSMGRAISFKDLAKIWRRKSKEQGAKQEQDSEIVETWEQELGVGNLSLSDPLRFPQLTRLSLGNPSTTVSWNDLLGFSKHLGALTHLSLAYWPSPRLPQTDAMQYRSEWSSLGGTDSSKEDREARDAAVILQTLSRNTPCLQWISFAACHVWMESLWPHASQNRGQNTGFAVRSKRNQLQRYGFETEKVQAYPPAQADQKWQMGGPEWNNSWRRVGYVNVSQDWTVGRICARLVRSVYEARMSYREDWRDKGPNSISRRVLQHNPGPRDGEPERYRVVAPSGEVEQQMRTEREDRGWAVRECWAIRLAAKVQSARREEGLKGCKFDFGWGGEEAIAAGYNGDTLGKAGRWR